MDADRKALIDCIGEKIETSRVADHDEQDLTAQQEAAWSAMTAAAIGIVTLVISGVGLWALLRTIHQGERALNEAREANRITRDEQRAWLDFDLTIKHPGLGKIENGTMPLNITATIKNIGKGIATDVVFWQTIPSEDVTPQNIFDRTKGMNIEFGVGDVLPPNGETTRQGSFGFVGPIRRVYPAFEHDTPILVYCVRYKTTVDGSEKIRHRIKIVTLFNGRWPVRDIDLPLTESELFLLPMHQATGYAD